VQPFLIPAASVNAPHKRERIWFVAYSESARAGKNIGRLRSLSKRCNTGEETSTLITNTDGSRWEEFNASSKSNKQDIISGDALYSNSSSEQGEHLSQEREGKFDRPNSRNEFNNFKNFPTQSPICNGDDGVSERLDSITFSKWRNESIKAGGNAIVPQVAYEIFKTIEKFEK